MASSPRMGSVLSREPDSVAFNPTLGEVYQHPLLATIDNPINRFCDDFASSLVPDTSQKSHKVEVAFNESETDEIEGYTILRKIGNGAEAIVYEAVKKKTTTPIALKKYKQVRISDGKIPREVIISNLLDHPHCIKVIDSWQLSPEEYIVSMPLAKHGALNASHQPEITVTGALQLIYHIASALDHMHSRNIVHRDIKPGNILIFDNGFCVCDYSVSSILQDEKVSGVTGTQVFMAPEISNTNYDGKPVDIWALGITVYVLVYGQYPFDLAQIIQQGEATGLVNNAKKLTNGELTFPQQPSVPEELREIISGMLAKAPGSRLTAKQIIENEWLKTKVEEWEQLMQFARAPDELQQKDSSDE